jgi:GNAT superfamily N-acetyltransferase
LTISYAWRGEFGNAELNELHAEAFGTRVFSETEWNWRDQVERHSLGWVVARDAGGALVGFVNVPWDGLVHAWLQDTIVAERSRHQGIATRLVAVARDEAAGAGCEWLHVDFDEELRAFYIDTCGFTPAAAGVMELTRTIPPSIANREAVRE